MPWAAATHALPPCAWLARLGLHAGASQPAGTSAWQRECPCGGPEAAPWGAAAPLLHQLWAGGSSEADGTGAAVPAAVLSRTELLIELGDWLRLPPAHAPCLLSQVGRRVGPAAGGVMHSVHAAPLRSSLATCMF